MFAKTTFTSFFVQKYVRGFASATKRDEQFISNIRGQLKEIESAGTYKRERIIISSQSSSIMISTPKQQNVLNFW